MPEIKSPIEEALRILRDALIPFVERALLDTLGEKWPEQVDIKRTAKGLRHLPRNLNGSIKWAPDHLLGTIPAFWQTSFQNKSQNRFRPESQGAEFKPDFVRSYINDLIRLRNKWAHESITARDTIRFLESATLLLHAAWADDAATQVHKILEGLETFRQGATSLKPTEADVRTDVRAPKSAKGLAALLREKGMPLTPVTEHVSKCHQLPIIESVVTLEYVNGYEGLEHTSVKTPYAPLLAHSLPAYVQRRARDPDMKNGPKLFAAGRYEKGILDDDNRYIVRLGKSDYFTFLDLEESADARGEEICRSSDPAEFLRSFPFIAAVDTLVVSSDDRVILGLRPAHVRFFAKQWHLMGEQMDPNRDRNFAGGVHPVVTVLRGVGEELNLGDELLQTSNVRFLSLLCNVAHGSFSFGCVARVPATAADICASAAEGPEGENMDFDAVPFTLPNCVELALTGWHSKYDVRRPVSVTERIMLLIAARNRFTPEHVRDCVAKFSASRRGEHTCQAR